MKLAAALILAAAALVGCEPTAETPAERHPETARIIGQTTDCNDLAGMVDTASDRWDELGDADKRGPLGDLLTSTMSLAVDRMEELGCP